MIALSWMTCGRSRNPEPKGLVVEVFRDTREEEFMMREENVAEELWRREKERRLEEEDQDLREESKTLVVGAGQGAGRGPGGNRASGVPSRESMAQKGREGK